MLKSLKSHLCEFSRRFVFNYSERSIFAFWCHGNSVSHSGFTEELTYVRTRMDRASQRRFVNHLCPTGRTSVQPPAVSTLKSSLRAQTHVLIPPEPYQAPSHSVLFWEGADTNNWLVWGQQGPSPTCSCLPGLLLMQTVLTAFPGKKKDHIS